MRARPQVESAELQFPTVVDFLEYMGDSQMLCFHKPGQPKVSCWGHGDCLPAFVDNGPESSLVFKAQLLLVRAGT